MSKVAATRGVHLPLFGILLAVASAATSADAAGALPHIKEGTPYRAMVVQLARQGFEPAPFVERPDDAWCTYSDCRPEQIQCGGNRYWCEWLFARRSDGSLLVVVTAEEGWKPAWMGTQRFTSARRVEKDDVAGSVVRIPAGPGRPAVLRRFPPPPDLTPLCSAAITRNCWVKPPPGWKPAPH